MTSSAFGWFAGMATAPFSIDKMGWFPMHMVASAASLEPHREIIRMVLSVISIVFGLPIFEAVEYQIQKGQN